MIYIYYTYIFINAYHISMFTYINKKCRIISKVTDKITNPFRPSGARIMMKYWSGFRDGIISNGFIRVFNINQSTTMLMTCFTSRDTCFTSRDTSVHIIKFRELSGNNLRVCRPSESKG